MYAAANGHVAVVSGLIAAGADVQAKDYRGESALMKAAQNGNKEVVELLFAEGADPAGKDWCGEMALD